MLKKILIKNFQSHKNSELEFSPYINAIVGRPNAGKTAILRAIKWVVHNRPSGIKFRTKGSSRPVRVSIEFNDGKVSLNKGKGAAKYSTFKNEYEGFSKGVPDEVEKLINFSELNIQSQLDLPFLAISSPQEIARTINRITKLEQIDEWVKRLTTKINLSSNKKKILSDEVEKLENDLEKYIGFEDLEVLVDRLGSIEKKIKRTAEKKSELEELIQNIKVLRNKIKRLNSFLKAEFFINKTVALEEKIKSIEDDREELNKFIILSEKIEELQDIYDDFQSMVELVEEKQKRIDDLYKWKFHISRLVDQYKIIDHISKEKVDAGKKFINYLKKTKICPYCFGKIDLKAIKRIEKTL